MAALKFTLTLLLMVWAVNAWAATNTDELRSEPKPQTAGIPALGSNGFALPHIRLAQRGRTSKNPVARPVPHGFRPGRPPNRPLPGGWRPPRPLPGGWRPPRPPRPPSWRPPNYRPPSWSGGLYRPCGWDCDYDSWERRRKYVTPRNRDIEPRQSRDLFLTRPAMRGRRITALQRALNRRGVRVKVDSVFGPGTQRAVMRYQRKVRLPANGIADGATRRTLGIR